MRVSDRAMLGAFAIGVVACLAVPGTVRAACGLTAAAVAQADVVFVGVLVDMRADGTATFELDEVWHGDMLDGESFATVEAAQVGLEPAPPGTTSRYLVLAGVRNGVLHTGDGPDTCALFPYPWDDSYASFRPAQVPSEPEPQTGGLSLPVIVPLVIGAAVVVGIAAFAIGASGRRLRSG